jgi:ADP-heptose:LPS heptosyltransferase
MRALFTSRNLVGDSLCISAALRAWHQEHPEYEIDLLTNNDSVAELYKGMGVPLDVIFTRTRTETHKGGNLPYSFGKALADEKNVELDLSKRPEEITVTYEIAYDFEFTFDVNRAFKICDIKKCHLAQGYADLLEVDIGKQATDLGPFYDAPMFGEDNEWLARVPDSTILLAPFSRSCASHDGKPPNKCLPWAKWKPILRFLRNTGHPIRVTGSIDERADELGFSEEEYLSGMPLRALARAMKEKMYLVVSVDNGLSHLAGSQKVPQILYYPMCLGLHYAVPWSNPYVMPVHMDPAAADPAQLLWSTKQAYGMLQKMREPGNENLLERGTKIENE